MKLRSLIIAVIGLLSVGSISAQANLLNAQIPEQVGMKTPEQLAADNDRPLPYGYIDDRNMWTLMRRSTCPSIIRWIQVTSVLREDHFMILY